MILGVIADDFTGATDIASMLVGAGMNTVQTIGVPAEAAPLADALVISLKSRSIAATDAVRDSLAALHWLRQAGARQIYFKYCSTFDSTPQGNIGPVAEALLTALQGDFAVACPALPQNGRTVYQGHLFIDDTLLSESSMRHHPLTPMHDANLVRVLQAQVSKSVALAALPWVRQGASALRQRLDQLRTQGHSLAIVDAVDAADLLILAEACADMPLITGGSGIAQGLPAAYARRGWLAPSATADQLARAGGGAAIISGSCSAATRAQVQHWLQQGRPAQRLEPLQLAQHADWLQRTLHDWRVRGRAPTLFYVTAAPEDVQRSQQALGADKASALIEQGLGALALGLAQDGVRRFVVAGGETSGAVVQALGVRQLRIGPSIAPGVPWTQALGQAWQLALKSGNFGSDDFFERALAMSE